MPAARPTRPAPGVEQKPKPEPVILFQNYFKSVGPRTYAAQVKEAGNGNHFLVLTEGKRDEGSDEVKKTRLFVFSEDFPAFFRMLHETAQFIRANPVSDEVKRKRERFWAKKGKDSAQKTDRPGKKSGPPPKSDRPAVERVAVDQKMATVRTSFRKPVLAG